MHNLTRADACRAHRVQYGDPIRLEAGAPVTVGPRDSQCTRWLWCQARDGREGWVPETVLSSAEPGTATATAAYEATEVAVEVGDIVYVLDQFDGFAWVRRHEGQAGWVPLEVLEEPTSDAGAA